MLQPLGRPVAFTSALWKPTAPNRTGEPLMAQTVSPSSGTSSTAMGQASVQVGG